MKRVAVFGNSSMALEALSRLDPEICSAVYAGNNQTEVATVREKGFAAEGIDFRNDDELRAIGIGTDIDYLFCFFAADSDNVFLTISARAIDKNLTIIALVDDPDSADKLMAAGANKIIDPYEICGRKAHEILTKPEITTILDQTVFRRHDLNIAQIEIPKGSWLENTKISSLKLNEKHNLILIGVVNKELGEELHFAIGEREHHLDAGDILVVMGPAREIRAFKEQASFSHKLYYQV
jgi:voltage-gated potassium channel